MPDSEERASFAWSLLNVIFFAVALVTAIAALFELRKVGSPGMPVAWTYATVAIAVPTALLLFPKIYLRLPDIGRVVGGLLVVLSAVLLSVEVDRVAPAWERTPAGAKEIADRRTSDQERAAEAARQATDQAERDETARKLADVEAVTKQLEAVRDKLEGCFSTFGHRLPALEDPVKASLHNPDKFEHVETVLIVPDDERNNVAMTFRAENGFGAIRTVVVKAQLMPDDCTVQGIGEPGID